jgi:hypothetical protein
MRHDQMTQQQRNRRDLIIRTLGIGGWTNDHENGDRPDFDPIYDAAMSYRNEHLTLRCYYKADTEAVYVFFSGFLEDFAQLKLECHDALAEVLDTLVRIQKSVAPDTVTENLREIVRICPETYAAAGPDGKLHRLVLEEDEEPA